MIVMEITISGEDEMEFKEIRDKLIDVFDVTILYDIECTLMSGNWSIKLPEVSHISDTALINIIQNMEGQR